MACPAAIIHTESRQHRHSDPATHSQPSDADSPHTKAPAHRRHRSAPNVRHSNDTTCHTPRHRHPRACETTENPGTIQNSPAYIRLHRAIPGLPTHQTATTHRLQPATTVARDMGERQFRANRQTQPKEQQHTKTQAANISQNTRKMPFVCTIHPR